MNTEESNKLIAEFMGWEIYKNVGREVEYFVKGQLETHHKVVDNWLSFLNMKYHSSWDWLMPVVEKIENLGNSFNICYLYCHVTNENGRIISITEGEKKIESTYKAVVEFIKWYNEQDACKSFG